MTYCVKTERAYSKLAGEREFKKFRVQALACGSATHKLKLEL